MPPGRPSKGRSAAGLDISPSGRDTPVAEMSAPLLIRIWLGLGWGLVLVVIYLSLTPNPPAADISQFDKVGHLSAYASLMAWWSQIDRHHCRLALMFVLLGLALEIAQSLTDYRQGDILDMAANTLGVGLGWLLTRLWPGWLGAFERKFVA